MKKIFLSLLMSVVFSTLLFSQDTTLYPFFPDRPGYSNNSRLVGLHRTDFETSFGYNSQYPTSLGDQPVFYNTNLFRFGMYKHLEFRFGMDIGYLSTVTPQVFGVKALSFGIKIPIVKDLKYFPDIAILGQVNFPNIGKPEFVIPLYSPQCVLLLQKSIGNFMVLGNVGIFYDGFNTYGQGLYSVCLSYNITPKFGTFIETYSFFSSKHLRVHTEI
jgi:hypothetical protein